MKKTIAILALLTLLLYASCAKTITDDAPPLSEGVGNTPPQSTALPPVTSTPEITATLPKIRLEIAQSPVSHMQTVTYTYVNDTDAAVNIVAIPHLERRAPDGWVPVEFSDNIGFCGTPDCLASNSRSLDWPLDAEYLYGKPLDAGFYRLSFDVVDDNYEVADVIFADFEVL